MGLLPRPRSDTVGLTLASAAYIALFLNTTFWKATFAAAGVELARNLGFGLCLALAVWAFFVGLVSFVAVRHVFKPVLILMLLLAVPASHLMNLSHPTIDALVDELGHDYRLDGAHWLVRWALVGGLPSLVVLLWRIDYDRFWREARKRMLTLSAAALVLSAAVYSYYPAFANVAHAHPELRRLVNPVYPIYASVQAMRRAIRGRARSYEPTDTATRPVRVPGKNGSTRPIARRASRSSQPLAVPTIHTDDGANTRGTAFGLCEAPSPAIGLSLQDRRRRSTAPLLAASANEHASDVPESGIRPIDQNRTLCL
ncbi:DUF1705 domain-containing protein [Salinisphaera sp. T31B1]|uniref:DUF1705 domain-containing protein n=1 Tax=Salinisphaera sp. T31B1 TaxID=727963 RepID=UPI0033428CD5